MLRNHKETLHQFVRFFFVGLSNTVVDFGVYIGLTRFIPFFAAYIFVANTVSFSIAATWSYIANRTWTFKQGHRVNVAEATRFYISTITAFLLNTLALFIVVQFLGHEYDLLGKILGSAISMVWNFTLNKLWVFKKIE